MGALGWLQSPSHAAWLRAEESRLLGFAAGPRDLVDADGRGVLLDAYGRAQPATVPPTFHTARMAHSYAIAALRGHPGARPVASALLAGLASEPGPGWADLPGSGTRAESAPAAAPDATGPGGAAAQDARQSLYALDHVLLAAASGVALGDASAPTLLERALARLDDVFWEPAALDGVGLGIDRVDSQGEATDYRGMNSNMHLVEALLAVSDATGDPEWRERALGVCRFVVAEASGRDGRILEHYDGSWHPLPEHNRARPDHAFAPFGSTIGHGFEWSRLIAGLADAEGDAELLDGARSLYARAAADGWNRDSNEGFVYTVDWAGEPVSRQRLWWVAAEAVAAASVLARVPDRSAGSADTNPEAYGADYERWLDHIATHFIDREHGSWRQRLEATDAGQAEVEAAERSAGGTLPGKTDLYHALQSMMIPLLPVATSVIAAIAANRN
ncbi:AGE family epimerase/isomerase [Subtercola boreus]|uniref:AGE family epimerase/isomerase n=1 Tax=Subtercola boreus TaxID=120213 RepID=UPI00155A02BB|nr:AGE family epimerase/isomerase [Subtercola boreus]